MALVFIPNKMLSKFRGNSLSLLVENVLKGFQKKNETNSCKFVSFFLGLLFLVTSSGYSQDVFDQADLLGTFIRAVERQAGVTTAYDPSYVKIPYPNGDVPLHTGVCSDVIIRGLRSVGFDLQKAVHEDMKTHFSQYPKTWGLKKTDTNIDHRRVLNLMCFFKRKKWNLPVSKIGADYHPGDIVAWRLSSGLPHIGVVSSQDAPSGGTLMVHNIGLGVQLEDVLFGWEILGHYRFPSTVFCK